MRPILFSLPQRDGNRAGARSTSVCRSADRIITAPAEGYAFTKRDPSRKMFSRNPPAPKRALPAASAAGAHATQNAAAASSGTAVG